MSFFSAGESAAAAARSSLRPVSLPARSSSTLSPLAPPFNFTSSIDFGTDGFAGDSKVVNPSSDYGLSFPHGGAYEDFRTYGNEPTLWQENEVDPSANKYGIESTGWLQTKELSEFPTSEVRHNVFMDPVYLFPKELPISQHSSSEHLARASPSLLKGTSYSEVLKPIPFLPCVNYDSDSSYDRLKTQVDYCRPETYYCPVATSCSSFQPTAPSVCRTSSNMGISTLKDESFAFEDPYTNHVRLKEFRMNQNFGAGCDEISKMSNVGEHSTSFFAFGYKSGLEKKHAVLPSCFTSPDSSVAAVDSVDQTVDSPCWKGASVSQESAFNSLVKSQMHVPVERYESLSKEQFGKVIYDDKVEDLLVHDLHQSSAFVPTQSIRPQAVIYHKQNVEVRNGKESDPSENILDQGKVILSEVADYQSSSSKCQPVVTGSATSRLTVTNLLARSTLWELQRLSEILVPSDNFDPLELNDNEHEALQLLIDNIGAFAAKVKKDLPKGSIFNSEPEAVQPKVAAVDENCVINQSNANISHHANGNMYSTGSLMSNSGQDNMAFNSSYVKKDQDVVQAFQKIQEDNHHEQEEKVQSAVYKKLWIDAEAALCSMKYELQLALMKAGNGNKSQPTEGISESPKPVHTETEAPLKSNQDDFPSDDDEIAPSLMGRITMLMALQDKPSSDVPNIDSSVMSRLSVLKSRDNFIENPGTETASQKETDDDVGMVSSLSGASATNGSQSQPSSEDDEIDPSVMARINVLPEVTDSSIMSRLKVLKCRNDLSSSMKIQDDDWFREGTGTKPASVKSSGDDLASYLLPNMQVKKVLYGDGREGSSLSSSDWEHVIMEELN